MKEKGLPVINPALLMDDRLCIPDKGYIITGATCLRCELINTVLI